MHLLIFMGRLLWDRTKPRGIWPRAKGSSKVRQRECPRVLPPPGERAAAAKSHRRAGILARRGRREPEVIESGIFRGEPARGIGRLPLRRGLLEESDAHRASVGIGGSRRMKIDRDA